MDSVPADGSAPVVVREGRAYDYFCGCGYHQLQDSVELRSAAAAVLDRFPFKQGPSHYGHGPNPVMDEFLATAARFLGAEAAIGCASGYLGDAIMVAALEGDVDVVVHDAGTHHAMRDAIALSGKPAFAFQHLDVDDLARVVRERVDRSSRVLLACDGVVPVTGRISPLPAYLEVLRGTRDFRIVVDDSHGTGVLGEHGRGTLEHLGIDDPRVHAVGTMSKALGSHGGVIPCDRRLRDERLVGVRMLVGSTELPNPTLAASTAAMHQLMREPRRITALHENALRLKRGFLSLGLDVEESPSGIAAITDVGGLGLESLHRHLLERGILPLFVKGGSYPGTPPGGAIKFTVFSTHETAQLDRVVRVVGEFLAG